MVVDTKGNCIGLARRSKLEVICIRKNVVKLEIYLPPLQFVCTLVYQDEPETVIAFTYST